MSALLGKDAHCYYATSRATWGSLGTDGFTHEGAAPAGLTELTNIKDLGMPINKDQADVTTRANNGWKATLPTLKDAEITFDMVYDTSDAGMVQLQKSFFTDSNIAIAVLDGAKATVGTRGFWMDCQVTKFEKQEPLDGAQMVSVALKPGYSAVAPEAVKVTS